MESDSSGTSLKIVSGTEAVARRYSVKEAFLEFLDSGTGVFL